MEELFVPACNRMRDLLLVARKNKNGYLDLSLEVIDEMLMGKAQVKLREGISVDDILREGYNWVHLSRLAHCTAFVWMGPDTVIIGPDKPDGSNRVLLDMLGYKEVLEVQVSNRRPLWVLSRSSAIRAAAFCEPLLRLLTETPYSTASTIQLTFPYGPAVSSLALSELLTKCTNLYYIHFGELCILTSEYLRVIRADCYPTRDRDRTMAMCWDNISGVDPEIVTDFLRNCPWKLHLQCGPLGIKDLSSMLVVETSVRFLWLDEETDGYKYFGPDLSCLFRALAKNKRLVHLDLKFIAISDANWSILCQSLARHPALTRLELAETLPRDAHQYSNERKTRRTKEFLHMIQENKVLETLGLTFGDWDYRILSDVVSPYLQYRQLFSSLTSAWDPVRPQLLAKALGCVNGNPEPLAMLLSNNTEIVRLLMPNIDDSTHLPCFYRALAKNKGLVFLKLSFVEISDTNWSVLCQSLARHPTIKKLDLFQTMPNDADRHSHERKTQRTKEFLEMLKENTMLETLHRDPREWDERILSDLVDPYLQYRRLFSSLTSSLNPTCPQLLAKALGRVSNNPEFLAMLFSNNTEIVRALMPAT
jgi:hypothetical protein